MHNQRVCLPYRFSIPFPMVNLVLKNLQLQHIHNTSSYIVQLFLYPFYPWKVLKQKNRKHPPIQSTFICARVLCLTFIPTRSHKSCFLCFASCFLLFDIYISVHTFLHLYIQFMSLKKSRVLLPEARSSRSSLWHMVYYWACSEKIVFVTSS